MTTTDDTPPLEPLFTHLYGAALGAIVADLARAQESERVLILGADPTAPQGWAPADQTEGQDDGAVPDPFPVIEFVQWQGPATFAGQSAGWQVLVGVPPFDGTRRRSADTFQEFLGLATQHAQPGARGVFLIPLGALTSTSPDLRRQLTGSGYVSQLVFPSGPIATSRLGIHPTTQLAVLRWEPDSTAVAPTRIAVPRSDAPRPKSFEVLLDPEQRWSPAALDPDRVQKIARWAKAAAAQRLDELAELLSPDADEASTVLEARQITKHGIDLDIEGPERTGRPRHRLTKLQAGDIVGRSIGEPNWAIVTEELVDEGLAAIDQVIVIRPRQVDGRLLLAFLRSDAASRQLEAAMQQATIPRISTRALRELLVPTLPIGDQALRDEDPIARFRMLSADLVDALERRYRAAFDESDAARITGALQDAAVDAEMAAGLVERVTDPLHRARQFLPHPLARTLRLYENHRRANQMIDVHQDLLRFGETAIILLGAIMLAYTTQVAGARLDHAWQTSLSRGGVPVGRWLEVVRQGAKRARQAQEPLGGLIRSLSTKSTLMRVLGHFLERRNEHAHGAGPRSPYEYEQEVLQLEQLLHTAVFELAPLARSDWFVVEGLGWSAARRIFDVSGRSLIGDHPDFDTWIGQRTEPLESGLVHVLLGELDLPLGCFCVLRSCSVCLHEELYYPDRLRGSMVRLRSLDRGHQTELSISELGLLLETSEQRD